MTPTRSAGALLADLACVLVFVLIGRASHGEDPLGVLGTSWPFALGMLLGWAAARAWRAPLSWRTVAIVWAVTVAVGMLLRGVSGQGVQPGFVLVTAVVLAVLLLGWRLVVRAIARRRSARRADPPRPSPPHSTSPSR